MNTIKKVRQEIVSQLQNDSDSPLLDAELLLGHCTGLSRTALLMNIDMKLSEDERALLFRLTKRRQQGEPIAYILGNQPFWTLDLIVTKDTLIPRPETECLVDWVLTHFDHNTSLKIADLGTGTGAIAIALATERPHWQLHATDLSAAALNIAKQNHETYPTNNLQFFEGNWCDALPDSNYDLIISNPPYIEENDPHLQQLTFEPQSALTAGSDGLRDIRAITQQAKNRLKSKGILLLEHGYNQASAVQFILKENELTNINTYKDLSNQDRFTIGQQA